MALRSVFGSREGREKKSLANKDYYKTLIEGKTDAAFLADFDGDLFLLNKPAQSLTGYLEEEIRDYHVRDLLVTRRDRENPLDARQFSEFTSRMFMVDARRYLIPVIIEFKEIEGQKFLITCVPDEEKEKVAGFADMEARQQGEPINLPPSGVASDKTGRWTIDFEHEARSLLNNMLGFGAILAKDPTVSGNKKLLVNIESIVKSGNQLKTLFNKVSTGEADSHEVTRTPCLIAPLLQKAQILLDPVARHNNQTIQIRQPEDLTVLTDEFLLLELLMYLLTQALLYTRNDQVTVDVTVDAAREKVLIVIDNLGQDIPHGIINFIKRGNSSHLYDLKNPVLAQSPEIKSMLNTLNLIDGKISFSSGDRMGEIARITLPVAPASEYMDDLSQLEQTIRARSLHVLIVEDDKFNAAILSIYLEGIADVSISFSGNEALNMIEDFYGRGTIFNVVIMDIGLPKPWDGILLKTEIEKRWPEYQNIPFLAQTAFTAKSYTDRITDNKFQWYLIKPINRSDLLRFILRTTTL